MKVHGQKNWGVKKVLGLGISSAFFAWTSIYVIFFD